MPITWQRRGLDGAGNLPAPTLPQPANGLTGAPLASTFSWTSVPGAAGYRIMVSASPASLTTHPGVATCSGCAVLHTTSGNSATSYTPASGVLAAHTLYYWQVQALESSSSKGVAAWSGSLFSTPALPISASALPPAPWRWLPTAAVRPPSL